MLKCRLLPLLLLVFFIFSVFAGCTININIFNSAEKATNSKEEPQMYESRATIYISRPITSTNNTNTISSSDLAVAVSLVKKHMQTSKPQDNILEKYSDAEYTLSLKPIDKTEIFTLIATSENSEHLEEICNMAVSLFCEKLPELVPGVNCKVVDYAKSTQLVETN